MTEARQLKEDGLKNIVVKKADANGVTIQKLTDIEEIVQKIREVEGVAENGGRPPQIHALERILKA